MRAISARRSAAQTRAALGLLVLVALAACTTPISKRYRAQSELWERAAAPGVPRDAGEALFAGRAELARGDLVRRVLERNPTLRAARHAWRAALARVPQETAFDDPVLGAGIAPRSIGSSRVNEAPKFDLSQKLPFPGKRRARGAAALGDAEAASHDYQGLRVRLAALASGLYDDYVFATRALAINAEHVALLEAFRRIATARYEAGEASQQDPIHAEVQLTHALHREVVLETEGRVTAERINALLHRAPRTPLPPPPASGVAPAHAPPPEDAQQLVAAALDETPELAAAAARVGAHESRLELARREFFPDVTLVGSYNQLWQERHLQPFVGIQFAVPLQLGRRRAAVDEAQARLEAARSERVAVEDEVRLAVQTGVDRLAETHHVERLYRDRLLPAARDRLEAARAGFETGRNGFLSLIDAQRDLLDVELGHERALADLGRRRAELDRARGRLPGLEW